MGKNTKAIHNRRPLSPHLTICRPQISSILSITHRISGVALFIGNLLLAWWLILGVYSSVSVDSSFIKWNVFNSWLGQILLFRWSFALIFHLFNGIRYLFLDAGKGFSIPIFNKSGMFVVLISIVVTIICWVIAIN